MKPEIKIEKRKEPHRDSSFSQGSTEFFSNLNGGKKLKKTNLSYNDLAQDEKNNILSFLDYDDLCFVASIGEEYKSDVERHIQKHRFNVPIIPILARYENNTIKIMEVTELYRFVIEGFINPINSLYDQKEGVYRNQPLESGPFKGHFIMHALAMSTDGYQLLKKIPSLKFRKGKCDIKILQENFELQNEIKGYVYCKQNKTLFFDGKEVPIRDKNILAENINYILKEPDIFLMEKMPKNPIKERDYYLFIDEIKYRPQLFHINIKGEKKELTINRDINYFLKKIRGSELFTEENSFKNYLEPEILNVFSEVILSNSGFFLLNKTTKKISLTEKEFEDYITSNGGHVQGIDNLQIFLEQQINQKDKFGAIPLCYALQRGDVPFSKYLLERTRKDKLASTTIRGGIRLNFNKFGEDKLETYHGATSLHYACLSGSKEILNLLLDRGDQIKDCFLKKTEEGYTPLHFSFHVNVFKRNDYSGAIYYLLTNFIKEGYIEVFNQIPININNNVINIINNSIEYFIYFGTVEAFQKLLSLNLVSSAIKKGGGYIYGCAQIAVIRRKSVFLELLFQNGLDPNFRSSYSGYSLLDLAILNNITKKIELFIKYGASEKCLSRKDFIRWKKECVGEIEFKLNKERYLFEYGEAVKTYENAIEKFKDNKINCFEGLDNGIPKLHRACEELNVEKVKLLLEQGYDPNMMDTLINLPPLVYLFQSFFREHRLQENGLPSDENMKKVNEILFLLSQYGVDFDGQVYSGNTMLSLAFNYGLRFLINALVSYGANPTKGKFIYDYIKGSNGDYNKNSLVVGDYSKTFEDIDLFQLLKNYHEKNTQKQGKNEIHAIVEICCDSMEEDLNFKMATFFIEKIKQKGKDDLKQYSVTGVGKGNFFKKRISSLMSDLINATDNDGNPPIFYAIHNNNCAVAEILIKHGAKLKILGEKLDYLLEKADSKKMRDLLKKQVSQEESDTEKDNCEKGYSGVL